MRCVQYMAIDQAPETLRLVEALCRVHREMGKPFEFLPVAGDGANAVLAVCGSPNQGGVADAIGAWRSRGVVLGIGTQLVLATAIAPSEPVIAQVPASALIALLSDRVPAAVPAGLSSRIACMGAAFGDTGEPQRHPPDTGGAYRLCKALSVLCNRKVLAWSDCVGQPHKAMVEVVRACNLRCPVCPAGNGAAHLHKNMTVACFERIAGLLAPMVWKLVLYNYGEPLLHPQLAEIVTIAKGAGIEWVELTTNGNVRRSDLPESLVDAGLDFIRFSIDGATQASYEQYRVGGDLNDVLSNMRRARAARGHRERPVIEAQMIVGRHNEHEVSAFHDLALANGADHTRLKTFNAMMSGERFAELGRGFIPRNGSLSRYADGRSLALRQPFDPRGCEWPWERIVINADGSIVPCCYDFNASHRLGSITSGTGEWWLTPARHAFRRTLRENPEGVALCSRCPRMDRDIPESGAFQSSPSTVGIMEEPAP